MQNLLEPIMVPVAYKYLEKLILQGELNKQNRKLCTEVCPLLAVKIKEQSEAAHGQVRRKISISRRYLIGFAFAVLVALELALCLPESHVLPHYRYLIQQF